MITHGISVIIPNFNGRVLLPQIIPPLILSLKKVDTAYEIIVVDDCSTDDSVNYLQLHHKEIIVLGNEINKGFPSTMNIGIFKSQYKYLLFLNNDVKLTVDYLVPLIKYFEDPDAFGVMGRIIGWNDDNIQDGGKYPYFHGAKIKTSGNYVPVNPSGEEKFYSMYLSGANALVSREKVIQLHGFDEIFTPYYVEDYELCLRAWRLGWKCYYEHSAICRHKGSVTIKSSASKKKVAVIYDRNKMFLHAIHLSGTSRMLWYFQLVVETVIRMITLRWYYLRALGIFIKSKERILLSVKSFEELSQKVGTKKTVKAVVTQITHSLYEKKIKRF